MQEIYRLLKFKEPSNLEKLERKELCIFLIIVYVQNNEPTTGKFFVRLCFQITIEIGLEST